MTIVVGWHARALNPRRLCGRRRDSCRAIGQRVVVTATVVVEDKQRAATDDDDSDECRRLGAIVTWPSLGEARERRLQFVVVRMRQFTSVIDYYRAANSSQLGAHFFVITKYCFLIWHLSRI